jgi:predicted metal-dependent hydrolase
VHTVVLTYPPLYPYNSIYISIENLIIMTEFNMDWPPTYTIRNSARAKQVILQISPKRGLVVIVPTRRRHPKIEELLIAKRQWIQKNLAHLQTRAKISPAIFSPPLSLNFHAIAKTVHFEYRKTDHKHVKIIQINPNNALSHNALSNIAPSFSALSNNVPYNNLASNNPVSDNTLSDNTTGALFYLIQGPIDQHSLILKSLKRFIKQLAQQYLIPWLDQLSLEIAFPYKAASIRSQSTLWGSCTAAKKISLNVKLLFLPHALTRYVLLHELCHTQHLNHSKSYWNLLKRFDPHCLAHRRMLRSASQYLPSWIEDSEED